MHRDCIIIVVSGHDEFEYAQRALQLKVFEYVLKPVPQDVLAGVLARAAEALAGTPPPAPVPRLGPRPAGAQPAAAARAVPPRLGARAGSPRSEIAEQARFLGRADLRDPLAMAVIHVVDRAVATAPSEERERRLALYAVRSAVRGAASPRFAPLWVFQDEHDDIVALRACARRPALGGGGRARSRPASCRPSAQAPDRRLQATVAGRRRWGCRRPTRR